MAQSPATSLASHLINQIRSNLSLLEQLGVVQPQDADHIRTKLPPPNGPFPSLEPGTVGGPNVGVGVSSSHGHSPVHSHGSQMSGTASIDQGMARLGLGNHGLNSSSNSSSSSGAHHAQVQSPSQPTSQALTGPPALPHRGSVENRAKAIWDYTGNESDDLRFRAGDIIIIDEEVNSQWYRGRVIPQGEQYPRDFKGLLPSNYVEKITNEPYNEKQPGGGMSMMPYQPPPPPVPSNSYYNQPPPPQHHQIQHYQQHGQVVVQEEDKKPNKFGKIGSQLGHSAVNGAGFGFGAAAASNLVNRIF